MKRQQQTGGVLGRDFFFTAWASTLDCRRKEILSYYITFRLTMSNYFGNSSISSLRVREQRKPNHEHKR